MNGALVARGSLVERFFHSGQRAIIGTASVIAGLIAWEMVVRLGFVRPLFLSSPTAIAEAFWQLAGSGELERHALISLREFAAGLILAVIVGLPIAILAGWSTRLGWFLQPLVAGVYAAPTVALFPLIIIFVGIGFWDKVLLVFISGFLQLYIAITAGIRATEERWLRLAHSFGASQTKLLWSVVLPGALAYILLGLRLAVGRSLVNVVVAEMLAAEAGLGYMIAFYGNTFKVANVFVALGLVAVTGVVFDQMFLSAEKRLLRWRPAVS
jgi:ABC-type nitrate/sulfonate/bicarbonate transport system permease component